MNHQLQLKGETWSTKQMEERIQQVENDILRYRKVENSADLNEYQSLKPIVEATAFQENKRLLLTRRYKDTEEYAVLRRYKRVRYSLQVLRYRWIRRSADIMRYLEFAKTDAYKQLNNEEALKADPMLRQMRRIDGSLKMRRYRTAEQSHEVQEYNRLAELIHTEKFINDNRFWKNPNRWYTTPESLQDIRYEELKKNPDILFFLAQDPKQIAEYESYKMVFVDAFEWTSLRDSAWSPGFYFSNTMLKREISYANELQANNHGHNAMATGSKLKVEVRKENAKATAWHPLHGFIEKEFAYTGDVINTAEKFKAVKGLFQAKIAFKGSASGAVYLGTGERLPLLTFAQWDGKHVTAGIVANGQEEITTIMGIKEGEYFVYSILITDTQITWYVNNQQVAQVFNTLKDVELYPAVAAFLPEGKPGTGEVDVDWIRVYQH